MDACGGGCDDWKNGALTVRVKYGYWSPMSLSERLAAIACTIRKDGGSVLILMKSRERHWIVFPVRDATRSDQMTAVFEVRWDASSSGAAERFLGSIEFRELPPPK
jgi:hypothetical protein